MADAIQKEELRQMIEAFYRFAGVNPPANLEINESVASVFGSMLQETRKCSDAFKWIPPPPGGRPSIGWLVTNIGKSFIRSLNDKMSFTCARGVIYVWGHHLQRASLLNISMGTPAWA
ncbi:MAG: hypothetical protein OEZ43_11475 [Gammaproteobacteria bacterium]|nr:hypothetical protein [Gammaproteobacteria bacterium]